MSLLEREERAVQQQEVQVIIILLEVQAHLILPFLPQVVEKVKE
jgi:hypothetical protein